MGYLRYDTPAAVAAMNAVYADLRLLQNLFLPSVKLVRKERIGARVRRVYDTPRTPLQRLQPSPNADPVKLQALLELARTLDPFLVARRVDEGLDRVYRLATFARGTRRLAVRRPTTDRPTDAPPRSKRIPR
jgi:hypothetical protein